MAPIWTGNRFGFGAAAGGADPPMPVTATGGQTSTPGDGYKYHVFNYPNSDNFVVSSGNEVLDVMVIGGGGGGGGGHPQKNGQGGGGGGGGAIVVWQNLNAVPGTYPIGVGNGGNGGNMGNANGSSGQSSTFGFSPGSGYIRASYGTGGETAGPNGPGPLPERAGEGGTDTSSAGGLGSALYVGPGMDGEGVPNGGRGGGGGGAVGDNAGAPEGGNTMGYWSNSYSQPGQSSNGGGECQVGQTGPSFGCGGGGGGTRGDCTQGAGGGGNGHAGRIAVRYSV